MIIVSIVIAILLIVWLASSSSSGARRKTLQRGMIQLDDVTQHTYNEIVATLGPPNSLTAIGETKLAQWISTGYHVAMSFDKDDKCLGIDSEVSV